MSRPAGSAARLSAASTITGERSLSRPDKPSATSDRDQPDEEHEEPLPLTEEEKEDVDEHAKLRPLAVYEIIRQEGIQELARPNASLFWSGIAAGLSIGLSVVSEAALRTYLPDAPWRPLVENLGYCVGFLVVIMARQQLFTEITLTAVLPVLSKPSVHVVGKMLRLWTIVFAANMVGTFLFAALAASELLFPAAFSPAIHALSTHVADLDWWQTFRYAIASGWLIATLVWLIPSAETAQIWIIILITYLIALFDLTHVVAGSVEIFYLAILGDISLSETVLGFLLPMLIGNIIGGSALFAILAYGQVVEEMSATPPP